MEKLFFQSTFPNVEFEKSNDADKANSHNGQIEIEDPAPRISSGKGTSDQRTCHATNCPDDADESKVVASFAERDHVGDDDFCDSNDASPASTLDGPTNEHHGEIMCYRANNGADGEEGEGQENERATTP